MTIRAALLQHWNWYPPDTLLYIDLLSYYDSLVKWIEDQNNAAK
nr:MAG TPA: hypothetical protein [Caudoviricetes sp.]